MPDEPSQNTASIGGAAPPAVPTGVIVAGPARDYRIKRYILVTVLMVYGLMSIRDGFYRYPRLNAEHAAKFPDTKLPYAGFDVPMNKGLGVFLPPFSVAFLAWCLYNSRGEYRLDGSTLNVPGHPPVPLNALRKIDLAKWDRKGIAYVDYQFPGTARGGRFKLDDFVYQREPTDAIFDRLVAALSEPGVAAAR